MSTDNPPRVAECTCLAVRQAARRITQFYDQHLAPFYLRTTQFSILAKLKQLGPMTINALADELVMDRTTLGRNILPLEREGLISVAPGRTDRRSKELRLTKRASSGSAPPARLGAKRRHDSQRSSVNSGPSGFAHCCAKFPERTSPPPNEQVQESERVMT